MDESKFGHEASPGHWEPDRRISYGPFFAWPPNPRALLKWFFGFPGYFLPWNVLYAVAALLIWHYLTPPLQTFESLLAGWIGLILLRNLGLAILVCGAWHVWLYVRLYVWRRQDTEFKYNRSWPAQRSSVCLFNNQTADNMFWTLASGVPIRTAYEVLLLWGYANGAISIVNFSDNPVAFIALFFLVPFIHVGLVHAPDRTHNLFFNHFAVFHYTFASCAHDQSGFAAGCCTGTGAHRIRSHENR